MQNMGSGSYSGALQAQSLAAAGRGGKTDEGTGGPESPMKTTGGMTAEAAMTNGKDYSARATLTNNEPRHRRED